MQLIDERVRAVVDCVKCAATLDNCHFLLVGVLLGMLPKPQDRCAACDVYCTALYQARDSH